MEKQSAGQVRDLLWVHTALKTGCVFFLKESFLLLIYIKVLLALSLFSKLKIVQIWGIRKFSLVKHNIFTMCIPMTLLLL